MSDVDALEEQIGEYAGTIQRAREQIARVLVGQKVMVDAMLIGLLADGHVLLEGAPGLAKTTAVKALTSCLDLAGSRIQFTPDLMPADLLGTSIYKPDTGEFKIQVGPVFGNIVLADEVNRAPPKVQSALLQAMQERQVIVGERFMDLPRPYLVMATQNPIEQEGTYPLPEAQVDRFMLKIHVDYPTRAEELEIVERSTEREKRLDKVTTARELLRMQALVKEIKITQPLKEYIVDIVRMTRDPSGIDEVLGRAVDFGASPRASISIAAAARAVAFLDGRGYCLPEDVKEVALPVLRHRIFPSYEAEADGITPDTIIQRILDHVKMP